MKVNSVVLQVPYIDDKVMWKIWGGKTWTSRVTWKSTVRWRYLRRL